MDNNLAENIRSYRKRMGLTQEQLAERLGITLGAVSKWERGSSEPDLSYIMELAELFHVSVDALIGFTMRGADADEEAARIEELSERIAAKEKDERVSVWEVAGEYDKALKKFPNHFRIVLGAALINKQIGTVYKKDAELKKALELFRHAIDLISQNRDPMINEVILRNEIAGCYSSLKNYKKAIDEYKKNNQTGSNDARIGLLYTLREKKPEEGIEFTERAFFGDITDMVTTMAGYMSYYISTARHDQGIRTAEWTIRLLESLKQDPARIAFVDKIICLLYLDMAIIYDSKGMPERSEENLNTAIRNAAAFDRAPVFTLENILFSINSETASVYDDTGPTAMEGLKTELEETGAFVSDAFRKKFERYIATA
jgi:transcriptional regulator with XRE-family HTH domain